MIKSVDFQPFLGISSPHLQTVIAQYLPTGENPPSVTTVVPLIDGDKLACEITTPMIESEYTPTIAMVHGLGGCHTSCYLIRLARKFHLAGCRTVRINLRGCGTGLGLATRPYNGGTSQDIHDVLKYLKEQYPHSPIILMGFSLGGNIVLKLAGELGDQASQYLHALITVCPTMDIYHAVKCIEREGYWVYRRYYLFHLINQSQQWIPNMKVQSIFEFDDRITAPMWGYKNAMEYYEKASSVRYLANIKIPCQMLFAADDPFIDYHLIYQATLPSSVEVSITPYGGHMGFLGWSGWEHGVYWMDYFVSECLKKYLGKYLSLGNTLRL